ncbi:glycosyltransferase family protein [Roseovarius sp. 2305UL8-3]|uniref:glycosyltransferase family protein n=1 Tax=Roseovarius conchicola TaxID=3121636 RepID=UPI00352926C1
MNVLITVTHLLGTGHLRRALVLARAFAQAGHSVSVASGGGPVPGIDTTGIDLIQLPPLRSDGTNFSTLLRPDGTSADNNYLAARRATLLETLTRIAPDVLITELFPFGRRTLSAEFTALLDAAHAQTPRPLILSSIRDILAPPSKPAKAEATHALIGRLYDGVLVHSDATATPLEISWPVTPDLADKLHYTGFVTAPAPAPHPDAAGQGEVLVSAGGGAVGGHVFATARAAAALTPDLTWRLLIGGSDPVPAITTLMTDAPSNLIAEPARPDFRQMLNHAACSVSLAGYNTALDLLQTGVPALLIPFDEGGEVEQGLRADSLARLPAMDMVLNADLTPSRLAETVRTLAALPRRPTDGLGFDGAAETVRLTQTMWEARQ